MRALAALLACMALVSGCAGTGPAGEIRPLSVTVDPVRLGYGISARVAVVPPEGVELKWVRGTVDFPGAGKVPEVKLAWDKASGAWVRRFPAIPPMFQIRPGRYKVRVWGQGKGGGRFEGDTLVEFN